MINENASIYIGIVSACILDHVPLANVVVRKAVTGVDYGYEIIGMAHAKTGESVQATHLFMVEQVRNVSAADLAQSGRLAGDSVGLQLRDRTV